MQQSANEARERTRRARRRGAGCSSSAAQLGGKRSGEAKAQRRGVRREAMQLGQSGGAARRRRRSSARVAERRGEDDAARRSYGDRWQGCGGALSLRAHEPKQRRTGAAELSASGRRTRAATNWRGGAQSLRAQNEGGAEAPDGATADGGEEEKARPERSSDEAIGPTVGANCRRYLSADAMVMAKDGDLLGDVSVPVTG